MYCERKKIICFIFGLTCPKKIYFWKLDGQKKAYFRGSDYKKMWNCQKLYNFFVKKQMMNGRILKIELHIEESRENERRTSLLKRNSSHCYDDQAADHGECDQEADIDR